MTGHGYAWLWAIYCLLTPVASAQLPEVGLAHPPAQAILALAHPLPPPAVFMATLPDSVRVKMLAAVARGDIAGAISMWQLATGRDSVPSALAALQTAFALSNRAAGPCVRVAKDIYQGFKFLGGTPQFIRISSSQGNLLSWQGRAMMSDNNFHVVVMMENKVYDAFTGPTGLTQAEYLKNLMMTGLPVLQRVSEEALP